MTMMTPEQTLDWLAEQHKSQCNEDRPVQEWIRSMKSMLPASVQEPVAWRYTDARGHYRYRGYVPNFDVEYQLLKPQALCLCTQPAQPAPVQKPSNAQIALLYPWMRPADAKELLTQVLALGTPAQPAPVPLTPEQVKQMTESRGLDGMDKSWYVLGITDSEAAHGIKEKT